MGSAPQWPSREGHRVITTDDGHLIFATDGLTDTYDDGRPGLGYELMMKLILPSEVEALEAGGPETRPALAAALEGAGIGWASVAAREPVAF